MDAAEGMTGEPRAVPVNDTEVLRAAHFAVSEFNAEQRVAYKLVSIKSAKIQVKKKTNFKLYF